MIFFKTDHIFGYGGVEIEKSNIKNAEVIVKLVRGIIGFMSKEGE
jgi:hypothetical protein